MVVGRGARSSSSAAVLFSVLRSPSPLFSLRGAFGPPWFSTFFLRFTLSPTLWWTGVASIATIVLGSGVENWGHIGRDLRSLHEEMLTQLGALLRQMDACT